MPQPAKQAALALIDSATIALEELWVREFKEDEDFDDDALQDQLEKEFQTAFAAALSDLTTEYGAPVRVGHEDDKAIPHSGVFRFAIWHIRDNLLWLAAVHEYRVYPFLLLLGCSYLHEDDDA